MVKVIRIPEKMYREAKKPVWELERKKSLRMAAGGWRDVDTEKMIKEIYESRMAGTKRGTSFD